MKYLILSVVATFVMACNDTSNTITPPNNPSQDFSSNNQALLDSLGNLETIAFGSCNDEDDEQPIWSVIGRENPDLWIWLGDNIYGDTENMSLMARQYEKQESNASYNAFRKNIPLIGTWDDHDYGVNNGNKTYPKRRESRDLLFEFLEVPKSNPAWDREGAYLSYDFGMEGRRTKIVLLDIRYFQDELNRQNGTYVLDPSKDILGEEQWTWFENELKDDYELLIVASGIQFLPEDHQYEKWANFPSSRARLFDALEDVDSKVVLLSGDRHIGEISQVILENGKVLTEVTSSGMTHSYEGLQSEPNSHRLGKFITELNFGTIKIDWAKAEPELKLILKNLRAENHLTIKI